MFSLMTSSNVRPEVQFFCLQHFEWQMKQGDKADENILLRQSLMEWHGSDIGRLPRYVVNKIAQVLALAMVQQYVGPWSSAISDITNRKELFLRVCLALGQEIEGRADDPAIIVLKDRLREAEVPRLMSVWMDMLGTDAKLVCRPWPHLSDGWTLAWS